jgi:hypothetical protein
LAEDLVQGHGEVGHAHHPDAEGNLEEWLGVSKRGRHGMRVGFGGLIADKNRRFMLGSEGLKD